LAISVILPSLPSNIACLAKTYTLKSKMLIWLVCSSSRYGFRDVSNMGNESSSGPVAPSLPNHERFCSLRTWKKDASSSS
jgi:hypothetical protein